MFIVTYCIAGLLVISLPEDLIIMIIMTDFGCLCTNVVSVLKLRLG